MIDGHRKIKFKITGMYPTKQLQLLNSKYDQLVIDVKITKNLERIAAYEATKREKKNLENMNEAAKGLDLDKIIEK